MICPHCGREMSECRDNAKRHSGGTFTDCADAQSSYRDEAGMDTFWLGVDTISDSEETRRFILDSLDD